MFAEISSDAISTLLLGIVVILQVGMMYELTRVRTRIDKDKK